MASILIVDDDARTLKLLEALLRADGHEPVSAGDGRTALERLGAQAFDLMVSDIRMKPMDGMELLRHARAKHPLLPVILLTAFGSVDTAQEALRCGAFDYLTKPFKVNELVLTVKRALADASKRAEMAGGQDSGEPKRLMDAIVAVSDAMRSVCEQVRRVAPTDASVLLIGESGTGKDLLSRVLHDHSRRRGKPWMAITCSSLETCELECALFGSMEDPLRASPADRRGLFVAAQGGTLFLDEVASLAPALQEKLLHVICEHEVRPIGGMASTPVNVRVLAASDFDLAEQVRRGAFNQELYRRLAVFSITIPPLRERQEDILPMARHFLRSGETAGQPGPRIGPEVASALTRYPWPGNVRELANAIKHAKTFTQGEEITLDALPPRVTAQAGADDGAAPPPETGQHRHIFLRAFLRQKAQELQEQLDASAELNRSRRAAS